LAFAAIITGFSLLKAMGSFGLCPQDDNEKSGYSKHQEF